MSIRRKIYDDKFNKINLRLKKIFGDDFIAVYKDLCDVNYCYFGKKDFMYFADSQHLSKQALSLLKETNFKVRKKIISLNKLKNFTY